MGGTQFRKSLAILWAIDGVLAGKERVLITTKMNIAWNLNYSHTYLRNGCEIITISLSRITKIDDEKFLKK